jgi:hypothetical protein
MQSLTSVKCLVLSNEENIKFGVPDNTVGDGSKIF